MKGLFPTFAVGDIQTPESGPDRTILKIAWSPPQHRWPFFGIVIAVLSPIFYIIGDLPVVAFMMPMIVISLVIQTWTWSRIEVTPEKISFRYVPFPAKPARKLKRDEIECLLYGPTYVKISKKGGTRTTYALGIQKRNGKTWTIQDNFDSQHVPQFAAQLMAQAIPGIEARFASLPSAKAYSWQMIVAVFSVPVIILLSAAVYFSQQ